TIPDSVTSIGWGAFIDCSSLESITIPDSVTSIVSYSFCRCSSLSSITIPDSVTKIDRCAFYECTALSSVTIGNNVTFIDVDAFSGCSSIENIVLPESVTKLGAGAFCCENLRSISIKNPECLIAIDLAAVLNGFDDTDTPYYSGVIYGYENSTAQTYAERFGFEFELLNEAVPGDISGNGKIDLYDAIEICKNIMGMRAFTDEEKAIADFNKDGIVNIYDAIGIAKELLPK
ncbi:MAG: leucine-rich repeat protein, partial [Porcipelethomonas sp.]